MPANANGTIKLLLVFIHKSLNPYRFKNIIKSDLPVQYYAQKNSWMDATTFTKWFHDHFVPKCQKCLKELGLPPKSLLFQDNAPSHPNINSVISNDGLISCLYLPPNNTSLIQLMDQGVLQTLERLYERDLLIRMLDRVWD